MSLSAELLAAALNVVHNSRIVSKSPLFDIQQNYPTDRARSVMTQVSSTVNSGSPDVQNKGTEAE